MTGKILSINTNNARFDPEAEFESPEALGESLGLTRGQKIAALERWVRQVLDRLAATSEGMATGEPSATDTALVDRINAVIAKLKEQQPAT